MPKDHVHYRQTKNNEVSLIYNSNLVSPQARIYLKSLRDGVVAAKQQGRRGCIDIIVSSFIFVFVQHVVATKNRQVGMMIRNLY